MTLRHSVCRQRRLTGCPRRARRARPSVDDALATRAKHPPLTRNRSAPMPQIHVVGIAVAKEHLPTGQPLPRVEPDTEHSTCDPQRHSASRFFSLCLRLPTVGSTAVPAMWSPLPAAAGGGALPRQALHPLVARALLGPRSLEPPRPLRAPARGPEVPRDRATPEAQPLRVESSSTTTSRAGASGGSSTRPPTSTSKTRSTAAAP